MPPNTVKVDRSTRWGNPFRTSETFTARDAVAAFSRWLETDAAGQALRRDARVHLRGRNLACWCQLDAPCHAEVLLRITGVRPILRHKPRRFNWRNARINP
jgi:hypothetical protein